MPHPIDPTNSLAGSVQLVQCKPPAIARSSKSSGGGSYVGGGKEGSFEGCGLGAFHVGWLRGAGPVDLYLGSMI